MVALGMAYELATVPIAGPDGILVDPLVEPIGPVDLELALADQAHLVAGHLVLDGHLEHLLLQLRAICLDPLLRLGIYTCWLGSRGLLVLRWCYVRL